MKFVACQYTHIEGYPPTFNALNLIAEQGHKVNVLARKDLDSSWNYNDNITLNFVGNYKNRFEFERTTKFNKIREFLKYVIRLKSLIKKDKPDFLIIYDNIPLMAFMLIRIFISKKIKIWYHNHDVHYLKDYKKYSLNYFAHFFEKKAFKHIDYFTLPAEERKKYFNLKKFEGFYSVVPNYPPLYLFKLNDDNKQLPTEEIKLIYPGSNISNKHGIEEIIAVLGTKYFEKKLTLTLIGNIREKYKQQLINIAKENKVEDYLFFKNRLPYPLMPNEIQKYQIGIAINKPMDITYQTGGTAANKTYEYAACGLPIILLDTPHYREHLQKFNWTFFTDLSIDSIVAQIREILKNYLKLSNYARKSFENDLNFEKVFNKTFEKIIK